MLVSCKSDILQRPTSKKVPIVNYVRFKVSDRDLKYFFLSTSDKYEFCRVGTRRKVFTFRPWSGGRSKFQIRERIRRWKYHPENRHHVRQSKAELWNGSESFRRSGTSPDFSFQKYSSRGVSFCWNSLLGRTFRIVDRRNWRERLEPPWKKPSKIRERKSRKWS